jgi:hypothetical protein
MHGMRRPGPLVIDQEIEQHYCSEIDHAKIASYIAAAATSLSWLCYREKWGRKQHGKPIYEFYEFHHEKFHSYNINLMGLLMMLNLLFFYIFYIYLY